jgi:type I restriction enzyme S subunit
MSDIYPFDWSCGELAKSGVDILDGDRGKEYPKETDFSENEYCLFLSAKNVTKSGFKFDHRAFITREKDEKLRKGKLIRNDLIVTTRGTVGNVAYFDEKVPFENIRINSGMAIIRNVDSQLDSIFLNQLLHSFIVDDQLQLLTSGSAQPQLTIGTIKGLEIPLPPLPEQHKIAQILTSVDEVIEKTQAQIDKLKDLQTGMMQELLTKGIGHTEFKDSPVGRIPVEWDVLPLDDIIDRVIDCEHKTAPYVDKSEFLVIRTSNVRNGELVLDGMKYTTESGFKEWTKRMIPVVGDVLFTREAPAGESCMVPEGLKVCMGQRMVLLRPKKESVDSDFFSFYLSSEFAVLAIYERSIGTTVSRINIEDIKRIPCVLPSIKEQQYIAKAIQSCQSSISSKESKLNGLVATKKALMQDLLTGKVRVNTEQANT